MLKTRRRKGLKSGAGRTNRGRATRANAIRGSGLGRNHSPKGTARRPGFRRRLRRRPFRKEHVLAEIGRTQQRQEAARRQELARSKATARKRISRLLQHVRDAKFQTALHSSVRKHLKEIHFGEAPEKLPGPDLVKAVALDLIMLYAGMTKLDGGDLETLKTLADKEMDQTIATTDKNILFRDIIERGNRLFEELEEIEDRAHSLAEKNRLAKAYWKKALSRTAKGFMVEPPDGKRHFVSKQFTAMLVERAAQTASITLADALATLKLVKGKPLEFKGQKTETRKPS